MRSLSSGEAGTELCCNTSTIPSSTAACERGCPERFCLTFAQHSHPRSCYWRDLDAKNVVLAAVRSLRRDSPAERSLNKYVTKQFSTLSVLTLSSLASLCVAYLTTKRGDAFSGATDAVDCASASSTVFCKTTRTFECWYKTHITDTSVGELLIMTDKVRTVLQSLHTPHFQLFY